MIIVDIGAIVTIVIIGAIVIIVGRAALMEIEDIGAWTCPYDGDVYRLGLGPMGPLGVMEGLAAFLMACLWNLLSALKTSKSLDGDMMERKRV